MKGLEICASKTIGKSGALRGTLRWFKGAQEDRRGSTVDIVGANKLLLPRGWIIGAILDASRTFAKSGGLRGRTKVVTGAQERA